MTDSTRSHAQSRQCGTEHHRFRQTPLLNTESASLAAVSTATANAGEVISSYVPPADIVGELKVQTASFDTQFG